MFFWVENLHPLYFFGSRYLSRIFLAEQFSNEVFKSCTFLDRKVCCQVFFLDVKFKAHAFFLGS